MGYDDSHSRGASCDLRSGLVHHKKSFACDLEMSELSMFTNKLEQNSTLRVDREKFRFRLRRRRTWVVLFGVAIAHDVRHL